MNLFLHFSDSAKYADVARNIVKGLGFGSSFSFWAFSVFESINNRLFSFWTMPPVMPYSIAGFFKIFGFTDFAVVATSMFYFLLTLIFTYLLGKKLFNSLPAQAGKLVGALSVLAVGGSYDMIHYALNGASESPFIFEIVAASYFASLKKKWANVLMVLLLVLMYLTRPQAFIYIAGIILFWLLANFKTKKAILSFIGITILCLLVDRLVLYPLNGKYFIYSVLYRGTTSSFIQSSTASDTLRGATEVSTVGIFQVFKNIFYNLYNFYKALPEIINPYLFGFFAIGLFYRSKSRKEQSFKIASLFMVLATFVITAASIPFYRYIHPVLPLIYILAVGTIVEIIGQVTGERSTEYSVKNKKRFYSSLFTIAVSTFLILIFGVGQTVGKFVLDSRFEAKIHNIGKPPVYVNLSKILKENTDPGDVIVTNLDTWGSWYGERKTIWFPLEPKQIIDFSTGNTPFDAIFLTSYKINDANYYMGQGWRIIFENPEDSSRWKCDGCEKISKEYKLKAVYKINSADNYEGEEAVGVLLIKK